MSELTSLKARVGDTTGRLVAAHEARRAQNETLIRALGDLETRFQAQEEELGYYRARLVPLEDTAMTLTALLDRLIALADGVDGKAANAGLYRAATAARALVELTAELEAARVGAAAPPEADDALDDELMSEAGEARPARAGRPGRRGIGGGRTQRSDRGYRSRHPGADRPRRRGRDHSG